MDELLEGFPDVEDDNVLQLSDDLKADLLLMASPEKAEPPAAKYRLAMHRKLSYHVKWMSSKAERALSAARWVDGEVRHPSSAT